MRTQHRRLRLVVLLVTLGLLAMVAARSQGSSTSASYDSESVYDPTDPCAKEIWSYGCTYSVTCQNCLERTVSPCGTLMALSGREG